MIDGIYSITFRGYSDWGMGVLIFQSGVITGADAAGVTFDGQYTQHNDVLSASIRMTVPAGLTLVQGTPPKSRPYPIDFSATIPVTAFTSGETVQLDMPPGPVNVVFRKLKPLG